MLFACSAIGCTFTRLYSYSRSQSLTVSQSSVENLTPASVVEGLPEASQAIVSKVAEGEGIKTVTIVTKEKLNAIMVELQEASLVIRKYLKLYMLPSEDIAKDADTIYDRFRHAIVHSPTSIDYSDWAHCYKLQSRNRLVLDLLFEAWVDKTYENEVMYLMKFQLSFYNIYISHINLEYMINLYSSHPNDFTEIKPLFVPAFLKFKTIFPWNDIYKS